MSEQALLDRLIAIATEARYMPSCRYANPAFVSIGDIQWRMSNPELPFSADPLLYKETQEDCQCVVAWGSLPKSVRPKASVEIRWDDKSRLDAWFVCGGDLQALVESLYRGGPVQPVLCWSDKKLVSPEWVLFTPEVFGDARTLGGFIYAPVMVSKKVSGRDLLPLLLELTQRTAQFVVLPLGSRF